MDGLWQVQGLGLEKQACVYTNLLPILYFGEEKTMLENSRSFFHYLLLLGFFMCPNRLTDSYILRIILTVAVGRTWVASDTCKRAKRPSSIK